MRLATIAEVTGGTLVDAPDDAVVTGPVVVDSRAVTPGSLFVAVAGEHVDGADYAVTAVRAGAVAVLATRPVGVAAVIVPDVVSALGRLARAVVDALPDVTVVGVTGSSGKTSTKDLLAQVLERVGDTVAPPGSFNNELGLPLTVLRADGATRYLVLELGARGGGHIRYLTGIAPPRIGVVLNVGSAHLGEFGGREGIAAAKGELVEALPEAGLAVLNADDPFVADMRHRTNARIVTFGIGADAEHSDVRSSDVAAADVRHSDVAAADVRLSDVAAADVRARGIALDDAGRPRFALLTPEGSADVTLRLHGEHHVPNALAVACVAREIGMPVDEIAAALSDATARSRWRMEVVERADGVTVINDAYNANPESVRAALKTLVAMGARRRRTWAVLGEMRELGESSAREHDSIGRLVVRLDVSRLVAVGDGARPIHLGASLEGSWGEESVFVPDLDAAVALLRDELRPGDIVLVKASRAAGLERVADALLAGDEARP